MAENCEHGYNPQRRGDGDGVNGACAVCEDIAGLKLKLASATARASELENAAAVRAREDFYRWWATLSNDERRDCWYDLDAMAHPEVVSSLKTKLVAATELVAKRDAEIAALGERVVKAEVENRAWRALAAESSGSARSLDFSRHDADSYDAEIVDYPGFGHVVATDGIYHSESFQAAAIALARKLGLLATDGEGGEGG